MRKLSICPNCGIVSKPVLRTRGSILIELILWLAFIVPGLIYSIWRLTTRYYACPECGAENMVPVETPRGRQLMRDLRPELND